MKESKSKNYIILTDEIKKKYPQLKNIVAIESISKDYNFYDSLKYAEKLKKAERKNWRLPTCSGEYRVNDSTDEIFAFYEAAKDLHNLAVEQRVEDDFLVGKNWWWSNEFDEDIRNKHYVWGVDNRYGIVSAHRTDVTEKCRCVC